MNTMDFDKWIETNNCVTAFERYLEARGFDDIGEMWDYETTVREYLFYEWLESPNALMAYDDYLDNILPEAIEGKHCLCESCEEAWFESACSVTIEDPLLRDEPYDGTEDKRGAL